MHILLYGKGWIAQLFKGYCGDNKITEGGRIDNYDDVYSEVSRVQPDRVVCMVGRTHGEGYKTIDYLEQKGKLVENVRDNLYAPLILADVCKKLNVHMTYLGTGCIFTYDEDNETFDEESLPNFFGSSYSTVKGFTDRLMADLYSNEVLNARIRMPIHSEPNERNFITKIVNYKKINSTPNSMTVLDHILPALVDMIEKSDTGTINLVNPDPISHNEILEMYKEIVDPSHTWENFTYEEQSSILLAGRSNNTLDTTLLSSRSNVPDIRTSVREILYKYRDLLLQQQ
jgi:dTDP-4-dehydrorhamnose reductase